MNECRHLTVFALFVSLGEYKYYRASWNQRSIYITVIIYTMYHTSPVPLPLTTSTSLIVSVLNTPALVATQI